MIHFFQRGGNTRSCETRPAPDGPGYDLIIREGRRSDVEHFKDARTLENRQYELRHAWMLHGWRTVDSAYEIDERD